MLPRPACAKAAELAKRRSIQTERKARAVVTIAFLLFIKSLLTQSRTAIYKRAVTPQ
jgi:hypothetical protein